MGGPADPLGIDVGLSQNWVPLKPRFPYKHGHKTSGTVLIILIFRHTSILNSCIKSWVMLVSHYDHHYTHVDTHRYSNFRTPGVGDTQDEQHGTVAAGPAEPAGSEGAGDRRWKCDS